MSGIAKLAAVMHELHGRWAGIPFENSDFQDLTFVAGSQHTPERAYRAICLRLFSKLQALRETYFRLKREEVRIRQLEQTLSGEMDPFARELAELDLAELQLQRQDTAKLAADALHTVAHLKVLMDRFPAYSREEFEAGEETHFRISLERQAAGLVGPAESLLNLEQDATLLLQAVQDPTLPARQHASTLHQLESAKTQFAP